jgi:hypothetical protein
MKKYQLIDSETLGKMFNVFSGKDEFNQFICHIDSLVNELLFLMLLRGKVSEQECINVVMKQVCVISVFSREHIELIHDLVNKIDSKEISEDEYNEIEYEYDEYVKTRFVIALCELHNSEIHGSGPDGHYLVHCKYKKLDMKWIKETTDFMHFNYQHLHNRTHRIFPNYSRIIFRPNYMKPEIVEYIYLQPDNHCVAIIKTFWLRLIQRTWKTSMVCYNRMINKA